MKPSTANEIVMYAVGGVAFFLTLMNRYADAEIFALLFIGSALVFIASMLKEMK